jgi:uncharacterized protein YraI
VMDTLAHGEQIEAINMQSENLQDINMFRFVRHFSKMLIVLSVGLLATQAAAQEEPNGYPIADVNLRAGPGTEYPVLVTVPTDAPITILGCLEDYMWCDTIFEDRRGWMRSIYLAGYYDGDYYLLSDYAPDLGYQIVTFDRAAYWDSYYQDEQFYNSQYRVTEARGADWVDDGVFYDRLAPHGAWTWTQGQYVWVPTGVDAAWRPYTRGRWIYTDYGWTWDSYEPFGWATYHYGRWGFSSRIGWFWVPGNRWGPAWVSWRQSDDYLAWAPLPPVYDRGGISISVSFGNIPGYYWSVVPSLYFLSDDLPRYYVRDRARWRSAYDRTRPIGYTKIVNKTVVNNVVNVNYVERHTNKTVVERKVRHTRDWDRAGKIHGNDYDVYRPGLGEGRGRHAPERPREIGDVANLSKTRDLARGEATTDDLLAPPEVRNAMKNRRGGRIRGEQSGPGELTRGETGDRTFDRRLPKGRDAEGPPPSVKKARTKPVPAHDLGPSRGDGRPGSGPRERAISAPDGEKGPSSARRGGPEAGPANGMERRRAVPEGSRPKPEGQARAKPGGGDEATKGPRTGPPSAERRASPEGKPAGQDSAGRSPSDRRPGAKAARSTDGAGPGEQSGRPQARSRENGPSGLRGPSDRKPAPKKGPPQEKAKFNDQNGPPQARSRGQGPSGPPQEQAKGNGQKGPAQARSREQGPSGAPKKAPPKEKAKPDDKKGPPQARSRQQGPLGPKASSDRRSAPKEAPPKKQAKPSNKKGSPQARSRQQGPSGPKAASNRRSAPKKAPPQKKAGPNTKKASSQARARQQSPRGQKASVNRKPAPKKAAAKQRTKPKPSQAKKQGASRQKNASKKTAAKRPPSKKQAKPSSRGKVATRKSAPKKKTATRKTSPAKTQRKGGGNKQASTVGKAKSKNDKGKNKKGNKGRGRK